MPRGKKRKAGGGKAAASKKITEQAVTEQAAEPMESGKYMWPTGCVKKYLTTVKKYCYVFYFNIFKDKVGNFGQKSQKVLFEVKSREY